MSFIQFESAAEKEKIRQELRSVREKLLEKAEFNAKRRDEIAAHRKVNQWMLPAVSEKIEKSSSSSKPKKAKKKQKKEKKAKKSKKRSKKKKKHSDSDSSDSVEFVPKKSRKRRSPSTSSSSSSSEDEWVEKNKSKDDQDNKPSVRDEWMSSGFLLPTFGKEESQTKNEKSTYQAYDPSKSSRELNPHWKDGGLGLPSAFLKPSDDISAPTSSSSYLSTTKRQGWKKPQEKVTSKQQSSSSDSESSSSDTERGSEKATKTPEEPKKAVATDFLSDVQMNELGAKMIKAEIMGNTKLAAELKEKLEKAKLCRENAKEQVKTQKKQPDKEQEEVLLTATDSRGVTRPVSFRQDSDLWGGRRGSKKKRPKVETHTESGERARFFPDDDHRSLKDMFESEKMISASDSDAQYAKIAGKKRRQGDDLEDIFAEEVRRDLDEDAKSARDRDRAIRDHERLTRTLETCEMCFDSSKMAKELIVAMGSKVYLSLPWHEALQTGHCIISPIQHVSCSTQLDEDVWREVQEFQTALIRMFAAQKKDCVFYEIANKLHKRPHLAIHCIPSSEFELAPFYFKKAIQESEAEWAQNRQLIDLKKEAKSVRRAIPRGLPYFWVSFTEHAGFAHVIEDQERFPSNFAMEILGGLLNLDARKWRKPRREHNIIQKVKQFADYWKKYDITK
ncbi:CWF19-like protein 2 homolog [Lutzomyia longipalpis]|uniref:CWF19-like protein 2 homolog n=1 Tax=Lutzomyia longipalpis TaxID=7200 RepID=UPI002483ED26|nr:CWF19-like protein 2 homolog [Lutzomyia longipalpis]